jgi:hypothetical protein
MALFRSKSRPIHCVRFADNESADGKVYVIVVAAPGGSAQKAPAAHVPAELVMLPLEALTKIPLDVPSVTLIAV